MAAVKDRRSPKTVGHHRLEHSNVVVLHAHSLEDCPVYNLMSTVCPLHWRSAHPMRGWEQTWSEEIGFGRICPEHGTIHPDPDDTETVWSRFLTTEWLKESCDCSHQA